MQFYRVSGDDEPMFYTRTFDDAAKQAKHLTAAKYIDLVEVPTDKEGVLFILNHTDIKDHQFTASSTWEKTVRKGWKQIA